MADEPTLTRGERGDWVRYLKDMLTYQDVQVADRDDDLEDDDEYGRKTARAIRKFQRHHGLAATGRVDEDTWRLLAQEPDPERKPPGAGDDEDDDNDDDDDDDYRRRRRERGEGGDRGRRGGDDDDNRERGRGGGESGGGSESDEEEPGGFLEQLGAQLGIDLDFADDDKPKIELAGKPWIEEGSLNWRVKNTGKGEASYYSEYLQVVDANNGDQVLFYMDYQSSENLAADADLVASLALDEFNRQAQDHTSQFTRRGRYRLDVFVDTENGWDNTDSVEFEVTMEDDNDSDDDTEDEDREDFRPVASFRYP